MLLGGLLIWGLQPGPLLFVATARPELLDRRRPLPAFARETFTDWFDRRRPPASAPRGSVVLFHDTFIKLGPLPLPLIRKAMLGETGKPL